MIHGTESVTHLGDGAFSGTRIASLYWEDAFALCPNLCLIVCAGSYAEAYATENDIPHIQAAP